MLTQYLYTVQLMAAAILQASVQALFGIPTLLNDLRLPQLSQLPNLGTDNKSLFHALLDLASLTTLSHPLLPENLLEDTGRLLRPP